MHIPVIVNGQSVRSPRALSSIRPKHGPIFCATNPVGMGNCTETTRQGFSDRPPVPVLCAYAYQEANSSVLAGYGFP